MMMNATSAKALAALILISTQGEARLKPQLPLQVTDRGASWLVKGTPFTDTRAKAQYCMFYIFIEKKTARVLALNFVARAILSDAEKKDWQAKMTKKDFDRIFGPQTVFEPDGAYLDLNGALYGGVINRPEDAVAYGHILMQTKPGLALIPERALHAEERADVWHVSSDVPGQAQRQEILSFSRYDGRLLSGDL